MAFQNILVSCGTQLGKIVTKSLNLAGLANLHTKICKNWDFKKPVSLSCSIGLTSAQALGSSNGFHFCQIKMS